MKNMVRHANIAADDLKIMEKLRARRITRNVSQTEVAAAIAAQGIRMNQPGLSRAEKGERAFSVAEASAYARALHTTLEELLSDDLDSTFEVDARATLRALHVHLSSLLSSASSLEGAIQDLLATNTTIEQMLASDELEEPQSRPLQKLKADYETALSLYADELVAHHLNTAMQSLHAVRQHQNTHQDNKTGSQ